MTTRKTVLILMHNDVTHFIDIANQYVTLFDKNKYEVTVAYLTGDENEQTIQRTTSEKVLFLKCSKKDIRGLKIQSIKKLTALCREHQFSLVVSHRYKPSYIMMWVSRFCKIPTLISVMHAMETMHAFSRKIFIASIFRKNMYFAGVSDAVRDELREQLWGVPKNHIITLYNCIDMQASECHLFSRSDARQKLNLPEDALVLGNIARLVPDKDQHTLLHAFAQIKSQLSNAKLVIVGVGALEQDLKQLATQLNLQNDVIFTGFLTGAYRYLKAFDIFVLSSVEEAFGRVLLEAMIARVPVVGTRADGIPEVIGDAGIMVEARNPTALANAILHVAKLPREQFLAMGDSGYERIKARFSTDKFHEDFWEIINA